MVFSIHNHAERPEDVIYNNYSHSLNYKLYDVYQIKSSELNYMIFTKVNPQNFSMIMSLYISPNTG